MRERRVAEGTPVPVIAVSEAQFKGVAFRPEALHGVWCFGKTEVSLEFGSLVARGTKIGAPEISVDWSFGETDRIP